MCFDVFLLKTEHTDTFYKWKYKKKSSKKISSFWRIMDWDLNIVIIVYCYLRKIKQNLFAFYKRWVGGKSKEWNEIDDLKYLRETTGPFQSLKLQRTKEPADSSFSYWSQKAGGRTWMFPLENMLIMNVEKSDTLSYFQGVSQKTLII